MGKAYKDMSSEEKEKHKLRCEKYRKAHPEVSRRAALKQYYKNPQKAAIKAKQWQEKNKDYVREKQKTDKRARKKLAIDIMGNVCLDCQTQYHPAVYEFHHLDPTLKDHDPSKLMGLSVSRLKKELENCVMLCANCHRLRHHKDSYNETKLL